MSKQVKTIRPRERDTIIQALSAGVVPRIGLPHIQVGRAKEIAAMLRDIDRIADAGAAIRFVIGEYGAGKTFFASVVRLIALERKCVTMHADLSPNRRIQASGGQARALYSEAVNNMATRNKPEGGALQSVVERLVTDAAKEAAEKSVSVEKVIDEKLGAIAQLAGGYDFATVLKAFWRGSEESNELLKQNAIRWLRGEYSTRTDAKRDLGVRTIIDDENLYDSFKSLACLVRVAGYAGLIVMIDEMANIYKLQSAQARKQNYEQVLNIVNDALQGNTSGIGFVMCGTPEFLLDTRRGMFSYEALQSRLAENSFAAGGLVDMSGPVIRLQSLTPEDLLVLLGNIRMVFAGGDPTKYLVPDDALTAFMEHCDRKIGAAYFRTPRSTIRSFVQMLSVLEQNPDSRWQDLLERVPIAPDAPDDVAEATPNNGDDDELTSLRLKS
ncbi:MULTISPECIES: ATP-binding protein [unclassified Bradyrhizobium]|uniref:ATP-binding protein n=1 Tax=unclassified Bradyrhizobium TaxID=2631580 RepID=UPI001CD4C01F|nr:MULTISPECIES: ATP-binding protein [unclassified Bradyrhizobium]MCA1386043.1 ATP-binding protein [Bradyrhizobium sp. BRP05]MCA1393841.1 ATP-binding protein [Bradyrhizobium sp. IC3123]MCA1423485.1 ATP-binding protein [Bradyrhizobium sp. BRP23]MCA1430621.1 ATP-binding protein [Bradyrhizobium sp. NBAIM16]MCA1471198.1 ATP-binding protein [Bradyrhizobium sp. IC3195]